MQNTGANTVHMLSPAIESISTRQEDRKWPRAYGLSAVYGIRLSFWLSPPSLLNTHLEFRLGSSCSCKGFWAWIWRRELVCDGALVLLHERCPHCALSRHLDSPPHPPRKPRFRLGTGHKGSLQLRSISQQGLASKGTPTTFALCRHFKWVSQRQKASYGLLTRLSVSVIPERSAVKLAFVFWEWLQWADYRYVFKKLKKNP